MTERDQWRADNHLDESRRNHLAIRASLAARPRLFTICDDDPAPGGGIVFAWGLAFDDEAVVYRRPGHLHISESAERALHLYTYFADVRLIWLDPAPPHPGTAAI